MCNLLKNGRLYEVTLSDSKKVPKVVGKFFITGDLLWIKLLKIAVAENFKKLAF